MLVSDGTEKETSQKGWLFFCKEGMGRLTVEQLDQQVAARMTQRSREAVERYAPSQLPLLAAFDQAAGHGNAPVSEQLQAVSRAVEVISAKDHSRIIFSSGEVERLLDFLNTNF